MSALVRQAVMLGQLAWKSLTRSTGLWVVAGGLVMASGAGIWWQDFNFGSAEERFLISFGWGVQNLGGITLALAASLQIWARDETDLTLEVWRSRGISALAITLGRLGAVALFMTTFAVASSMMVMIAVGWAGHSVAVSDLLLPAAWLVAKTTLVSAVIWWIGSWSRSVGLLIGGCGGILLVGHLRPWAMELGGVPMVLSWLAPDFAGLAARPTWATAGVSSLLIAGAYLAAIVWLTCRGMGKRS